MLNWIPNIAERWRTQVRCKRFNKTGIIVSQASWFLSQYDPRVTKFHSWVLLCQWKADGEALWGSICMNCCAGLDKRVLVILVRDLNAQCCRLGWSAAWKNWEGWRNSTFIPRVRVKLLICADGMHSVLHKHGHKLWIWWWHFKDLLRNCRVGLDLIRVKVKAILDCVMPQSQHRFYIKKKHRTFLIAVDSLI